MFSIRPVVRFCVLSIAYPILISACTPTFQWVKPETEPGIASQQEAACTLQAETTYISSEEAAEARASRIAHWTSLCMRANGYRRQEVVP